MKYNPEEVAALLKNIIDMREADKIKEDFIHKFIYASVPDENGNYWISGKFNIGGTISGRMSSGAKKAIKENIQPGNPINMQNLPSSGTIYAKEVKKCIKAPEGWLYCGADFDALEDKISALITKDPNKLKVYCEGFDGHCLRMYYYFPKEFPVIEETADNINKLKSTHKELRQKAKGPYFALTYHGTIITLIEKFGFSREEAIDIYNNHHRLYRIADEFVEARLTEAAKTGYVTGAFGLKLRTPLIAGTLYNSTAMPYEAEKEKRTAGNMLGQSYGLLNNRSAIEFFNRVLNSPYRYDIKPVKHVHDSQYYLVRRDSDILFWFNKNLVECMEWQDLPEIQHPQVKITASVELYYPTWADPFPISKNATKEEIESLLNNLK